VGEEKPVIDTDRRLFVPLSSLPFQWFVSGTKRWEVRRRRGVFANGVTPGRRVELRRGYSDVRSSLWGTVTEVVESAGLRELLETVPYHELGAAEMDGPAAEARISEILSVNADESVDLIAFRIELDPPDTPPTLVRFHPRYWSAVESGMKTTTVRVNDHNYEPGPAVLAVGANELPATVMAVHRCPAASLTEADAQRDGFDSLEELQRALRDHYPSFNGTESVSILEFKVI